MFIVKLIWLKSYLHRNKVPPMLTMTKRHNENQNIWLYLFLIKWFKQKYFSLPHDQQSKCKVAGFSLEKILLCSKFSQLRILYNTCDCDMSVNNISNQNIKKKTKIFLLIINIKMCKYNIMIPIKYNRNFI